MKIKKTNKHRLICQVISVIMSLCMMLGMVVFANAADANQAVTDARNGVVQVQLWFNDTEFAREYYLANGTGFLINENTVVTCQHVVAGFDSSVYSAWAKDANAEYGTNLTAGDIKDHMELRISVYRDVYVKATIKKASYEMDYAVLTLNEPIVNRTPLKLRDSSELAQTEEVFALGFPADMEALQVDGVQYFEPKDVTITSGRVNKVGESDFITTDGHYYEHVKVVESSAYIASGNSGGPLVDAKGNVVGISAAGNDTRHFSVASENLIDVLNALGIEYASSDSSVSVDVPVSKPTEETPVVLDTSALSALISEAEDKDSAAYTEESYKKLSAAIKAAKSALNASSQNEIDDAVANLEDAVDTLEENSNNNSFIIIGAIVLAVIAVAVIVIVVLSKKKKNNQTAAPATAAAPAAHAVSVSAETTVLNQGAGETTVLSQNINGGTLLRVANNERIPICSAEFTVGRERNSVDYCVGGNTNISRVHARFVVRDDATYIVDNNAANGTFVNGVEARAGQEIKLNSGDKIVLADEKFEFNK